MSTLAEQLSELLDPSVKSADPEDDIYEETRAKIVDKKELDGDADEKDDNSRLHSRRMQSLEGMGSFYRGKVVSRKQIASDSEDSDEGDVEVNLQEGIDEEDDQDQEDDGANNEQAEDESSEDLLGMEGMDEEIDSDEAEGDERVKIFKTTADADPQSKGKATKNQLSLWESMLEARIKCQKIVAISNRLPQHDMMILFRSQVGASLKETDKVLAKLLIKLLELETKLLAQNSQTHSISNSEMSTKKRKSSTPVEEIDQFLNDRFEAMKSHRTKVLKLWYDKTRLTSSSANTKSKSFSSFERSTVTQINDILQDKERLIKRTQLKRSDYRILGTKVTKTSKPEESTDDHSSHLKEFDAEIFDDDDFYHQLLRQLIEQKASGPGNASDPVELTRQWLRIQRLRSKVKKNVDTKASKGRKIRYEVHQKLQSFMAPNDTSTFTHEARNQLFKSLFGNIPES